MQPKKHRTVRYNNTNVYAIRNQEPSFVASLLVNYVDIIRVLRIWKMETAASFKMILFMMNPHIYYDHHHHIKVQYTEIRTRMVHEVAREEM